jgi:hexosaminidase
MEYLSPLFTHKPAFPVHRQLAIGHRSSNQPPNILLMPSKSPGIVGLAFALLASAALAATPNIIPLPVQTLVRPGMFTLCPSQLVSGAPAQAPRRILVDSASLETGQYLATTLFRSTGCQFVVATNGAAGPIRGALLLTTVNALPGLGAEGYELTVAPDSVVIRAPAQAGLFYGVQSLLQLFPPQILSPRPVGGVAWTAPCVYIQDQPRFAWRGVMVDVSRHFFDKQEMERVLDAMALHKLNTLHWHLVDDQAWRVQILAYPLLTQTGAWRTSMDYGQNPSASRAYNASGKYGGYYTQDDIREVVAYAQQRHISIVPEVEMPGHSTAALASYPQYSCNPTFAFNMDSINYTYDVFSPGTTGTFTFLQGVLTELMGLFPGQYIHCGGDEVSSSIWTTYAADKAKMQSLGLTTVQQYQSWFSMQIANWLRSQGRTMVGWTEIEYGGILTNAVCMDWIVGSGSRAVATASAGQYVVMTPDDNCYINYCETTDLTTEPRFIVGGSPAYLTVKNVYDFEPMPASLPSQYAPYILGAQCNLWTEYVPSPENLEFKLFPRLSAMAEVTWTAAASKDYTSFTNRLVTLEQRLAQMGINYNREAVPRIGTWTQPVSTSATTVNYDITPYVTKAGEINVNFYYTTGANGLNIYSAALLENGVQIDINTYTGFAGLAYNNLPYYVLHMPWFHPGATYTIRASIAGVGGTASNGAVYLTNWN